MKMSPLTFPNHYDKRKLKMIRHNNIFVTIILFIL